MLPIYRAKKLIDDTYTHGYLFKIWDKCYIQWGTTNGVPNQIEIDPSTLAVSTGKYDINNKEIFAALADVGGDICKWGHGTPHNGGKPTELSGERLYQAKFGLSGLTWGRFEYSHFIYTDTHNHLEVMGIQK